MEKLNIVKSFFKSRKRVILDRNNDSEYLIRYYLFLKDRKSFPFNITLHKILMSDEPTLHNHPWNWGALIVKGGYWEHTPNGKLWRGPGSIRFRKADDLHWLELEKDKNGNEIPCWSLFFMGKQQTDWGFKVKDKIVNHEKYLKQ
tara:strand:- start:1385 stop:1819 length:435 start_codon:yes stop_codon:yes gene_type:complete